MNASKSNELELLIDDANYLLDSRPPEGVTDDEFKSSFLSSIKLVKLEDAQVKSSQSIDDLLSVVAIYAKSSAKGKIKSLDILDSLLYHDYNTYQKVLNILQNKES